MPSRARKEKYFEKLQKLFATNERMFVVGVDNVGSNQMQQIKLKLRGKAEVLNGKNTMMRKAIELMERPDLECIRGILKGNKAFVMTNGELTDIMDVIKENQVPASAKAGSMAPVDVFIPSGPTGLDPAQTSFFQALNIPTKINKGSIEITSEVQVVFAGTRVGSSEAALLGKLNLKPFSYGLVLEHVYDNGSLFSPSALEITEEDLLASFNAGIANVAAVSLATGFATEASVVHSLLNGFKDCAAVGLETDFIFKEIEKVKAMLDNPEAFASAAPVAAAGGAAPKAAAAAVVEEEEEEEETGFDLFD